ncbi:hypothetical protein D9756_008110 [Leucocoprinus leucothites]|uniref:Protein kinase domain-containing protein n=1 Tax=Leucocoprinus leucothites TaxID=201217 RepID=A0A8H5FXB3_9AGAR|nr:hypothetical protein D9756_008110 [Leucoagaricus leucothites]
MGNSHSVQRKQPKNAASQPFQDMDPDYQKSYRLLSGLVKERKNRQLLAKLEGEEAQHMANFLNRVLERRDLPENDTRKEILHTLTSLARTALVFPECLKLEGVSCDFNPLIHAGDLGDIYKGDFGDQVVCVKAIRQTPTVHTHEQLLKASPNVRSRHTVLIFFQTHVKEAILSAHMSHKNILPFYGVHLCSVGYHKVCIISPWMEHGDLLQYLKDVPDAPRIPLMSDMISGLAYMHKLSIVHSDLKAKNVLVSEEGRALLADFGGSRVNTATKTGVSVGAANWMAPELLSGGQRSATTKSDIWSFACTCYEYTNIIALTKAIDKDGLTPNQPVACPHFDNTVWKKMEECWAKEPKERPAAVSIGHFFAGLFKDDRVENGHRRLSIRLDRTVVDDALVHQTLLKVQKTPSTGEKKMR